MNLQNIIENGLNARQALVMDRLRVIYDATPSELSCPLISQATMTTIVDTLEKKGFVERIPSRSDRRSIRVTITELGEEFARS